LGAYSKPLLLIRADGDVRTGTGHVMRALAVAQAWQDRGGAARVLFSQANPSLASRLAAEGVDVSILGCERGGQDDVMAVIAEARQSSPDGVVVDGYAFGTEYLSKLEAAGRPITLFDDYVQASRLPVQMVVNQNLYADVAEYAAAAPTSRLLVGPEYLVLRREFRAMPTLRQRQEGTVRRIVVTLGGGDADNVTSLVLDALATLAMPGVEVVVLAGAQNPYLAELRAKVQSLGSGFRLEVDRRDMPTLLATCDLAICGAGLTCWEMAYMGVATLPIVLAQNQERIAATVDARGIGHSLGWNHSLDARDVAQAVRKVTEDPQAVAAMRARSLRLFDGLGAERVVEEIAKLGASRSWTAGQAT
jgi:UDP-2,4-diacetamido-2,4,6-trideoxy-beta-L-altropyranose hydrolase